MEYIQQNGLIIGYIDVKSDLYQAIKESEKLVQEQCQESVEDN